MKGNFWFTTYTGKYFDLGEPTVDMVDIRDIAASLSRQCRFNGHCRTFYSVAEHSIHVADSLPGHVAIYGLLHDAHESYIGDMTAPNKAFFRTVPITAQRMEQLEHALDAVIYRALGLPMPTDAVHREVKTADMRMLATERRDLFPNQEHTRPWLVERERVEPFEGITIKCLEPGLAESVFMDRFGIWLSVWRGYQ